MTNYWGLLEHERGVELVPDDAGEQPLLVHHGHPQLPQARHGGAVRRGGHAVQALARVGGHSDYLFYFFFCGWNFKGATERTMNCQVKNASFDFYLKKKMSF